MNKTAKKLLWPLVQLRRWHDAYLIKHNPERMFSIWHKRSTGVPLNIDNPQTLDDKIAYMAFRTDTSEWSRLADKVRVRDYVEECGYGEYLPKMYGTWEKADDINFDELPNAFVIKTNNASATNILVRDKSKIDVVAVRKQLDDWLKDDYGYRTCQPHYSRIKPLILAEEFLGLGVGKMLIDYKFYCVNGAPEYVQVMSDREPNTHNMKISLMDMDWVNHPEYCSEIHQGAGVIPQPQSLQLMKQIASRLSTPFPFVRIDFYEVNSKPVFGEMTFTPGFDTVNMDFEKHIGKQINLK